MAWPLYGTSDVQDFFIACTDSPNWSQIRTDSGDLLEKNTARAQQSSDRPDKIARVFSLKAPEQVQKDQGISLWQVRRPCTCTYIDTFPVGTEASEIRGMYITCSSSSTTPLSTLPPAGHLATGPSRRQIRPASEQFSAENLLKSTMIKGPCGHDNPICSCCQHASY